MAIGVYFAPSAMTAGQYGETLKRLQKAGAGHPPGRKYHASFGPADKLMVFDVWASQAAFEKFGKTLMPILEQLGIEGGAPTVMPIHRVIVPPAQAARRAAPKKRAKVASARLRKR